MSTVEQLVELLRREAAACDRLRQELELARRHEADAVAHRMRAERDRNAAEDKIEEWITYSHAWNMLIPRRHIKELKDKLPTPYDREIPF